MRFTCKKSFTQRTPRSFMEVCVRKSRICLRHFPRFSSLQRSFCKLGCQRQSGFNASKHKTARSLGRLGDKMQSTVLHMANHAKQLRIPSGSGEKRTKCELLVSKHSIEVADRRAQAPQPIIPPSWLVCACKVQCCIWPIMPSS